MKYIIIAFLMIWTTSSSLAQHNTDGTDTLVHMVWTHGTLKERLQQQNKYNGWMEFDRWQYPYNEQEEKTLLSELLGVEYVEGWSHAIKLMRDRGFNVNLTIPGVVCEYRVQFWTPKETYFSAEDKDLGRAVREAAIRSLMEK